jgi:hypothetical protein
MHRYEVERKPREIWLTVVMIYMGYLHHLSDSAKVQVDEVKVELVPSEQKNISTGNLPSVEAVIVNDDGKQISTSATPVELESSQVIVEGAPPQSSNWQEVGSDEDTIWQLRSATISHIREYIMSFKRHPTHNKKDSVDRKYMKVNSMTTLPDDLSSLSDQRSSFGGGFFSSWLGIGTNSNKNGAVSSSKNKEGEEDHNSSDEDADDDDDNDDDPLNLPAEYCRGADKIWLHYIIQKFTKYDFDSALPAVNMFDEVQNEIEQRCLDCSDSTHSRNTSPHHGNLPLPRHGKKTTTSGQNKKVIDTLLKQSPGRFTLSRLKDMIAAASGRRRRSSNIESGSSTARSNVGRLTPNNTARSITSESSNISVKSSPEKSSDKEQRDPSIILPPLLAHLDPQQMSEVFNSNQTSPRNSLQIKRLSSARPVAMTASSTMEPQKPLPVDQLFRSVYSFNNVSLSQLETEDDTTPQVNSAGAVCGEFTDSGTVSAAALFSAAVNEATLNNETSNLKTSHHEEVAVDQIESKKIVDDEENNNETETFNFIPLYRRMSSEIQDSDDDSEV